MPGSLLRFSVFDVENPRLVVDQEDGITFKLTERQDETVLWESQGDFASIPDGAKYRDLSDKIWGRALSRIKRLAEGKIFRTSRRAIEATVFLGSRLPQSSTGFQW